jgi:hypothetical protein
MSPDQHRPRADQAADQTRESLVELLLAELERTYTTAGQPGVLSMLRELLRGFSTPILTAMVHEMGLAEEPSREDAPDRR